MPHSDDSSAPTDCRRPCSRKLARPSKARRRRHSAWTANAVLAATGDRHIVEVSTRDPWWGARPVAERYEGKNVLGRLWMELRQQLRDGDPRARSGAWLDHIRVGRLAGAADGAGAVPQTA